MAFCNSCGTTITPGIRFCSKCGAPVLASTLPGSSPGAPTPQAAPAAPPPPAPTTGGSSALKIILIVVAAIVIIGILGIVTVGVVGYRIARGTHVSQQGDHVKVETPFGTVESSKDPEQAAKSLGVDIYPGAEVQKNGASSATFGNIRTVTAAFESSDSVDKVCSFYRTKFPGANVTTSDQNRCTIVSNSPPNMTTVNVESHGDASKFQITSVIKKEASS